MQLQAAVLNKRIGSFAEGFGKNGLPISNRELSGGMTGGITIALIYWTTSLAWRSLTSTMIAFVAVQSEYVRAACSCSLERPLMLCQRISFGLLSRHGNKANILGRPLCGELAGSTYGYGLNIKSPGCGTQLLSLFPFTRKSHVGDIPTIVDHRTKKNALLWGSFGTARGVSWNEAGRWALSSRISSGSASKVQSGAGHGRRRKRRRWLRTPKKTCTPNTPNQNGLFQYFSGGWGQGVVGWPSLRQGDFVELGSNFDGASERKPFRGEPTRVTPRMHPSHTWLLVLKRRKLWMEESLHSLPFSVRVNISRFSNDSWDWFPNFNPPKQKNQEKRYSFEESAKSHTARLRDGSPAAGQPQTR